MIHGSPTRNEGLLDEASSESQVLGSESETSVASRSKQNRANLKKQKQEQFRQEKDKILKHLLLPEDDKNTEDDNSWKKSRHATDLAKNRAAAAKNPV